MGNRSFASLILVPLSLLLGSSCQSAPKEKPLAQREPAAAAEAEEAHWSGVLADAGRENEFRGELAAELKNRVRTLSRTVRVYHYGKRGVGTFDAPRTMSDENRAAITSSPPGITPGLDSEAAAAAQAIADQQAQAELPYVAPLELHPKEIQDYYRRYSSLFQEGAVDSQVGPGIYAAVDPIQSDSYANSPWFLLEMEVPAGARYLDLRPGDSVEVSKAFYAKWFGYTSEKPQWSLHSGLRSGDRFIIRFTALLEIRALRKTVNYVLSDLRVDALAYSWAAQSAEICRKISFDQRIAFNFINPNFLKNSSHYRVFVENLELSPDSEKKRAYSHMLDLIQSYPVSIVHGFTKAQGVQTPPMTWSPPLGEMRVLTYAWAEKLHRKAQILDLFKNSSDLQKTYQKLSSLRGSYSGESVDLNLKLLHCATDSARPDYDTEYCRYDPLSEMRKTSPLKAASILAEYQKWTFGCSTEHPEENKTPEL